MMSRFTEMHKFYPDETYDQGPLLALYTNSTPIFIQVSVFAINSRLKLGVD